MNKSLRQLAATLCFSVAAASGALAADAFPTRPIRIIVNTAPGSLVDITARLVGQQMSEQLKQSVVVEARPGADGMIGIRLVKAAPADGYTLLVSAGTMALQMAVREDPGYDLVRDFTGIGMVAQAPYLLLVGGGQPDKTLGDFIARAKQNPGKLTFGSAGVGSVPHLTAERFARQAGISMTHVPYGASASPGADLIAGRIDSFFRVFASSRGSVRGGQERALAVTGTQRLAALPEVPTMTELGVKFTALSWVAMVAPAGTPPDVVKKLSDSVRLALNSKALKERYRDDGTSSDAMSPEELNQLMASEVTEARKLVKDLGLQKLQ